MYWLLYLYFACFGYVGAGGVGVCLFCGGCTRVVGGVFCLGVVGQVFGFGVFSMLFSLCFLWVGCRGLLFCGSEVLGWRAGVEVVVFR